MASNIRRHLDEQGLNVKDFAKLLNFKYSTVLDWVNAKTYPRIDKIEIMSNYFGVEKSDLVEVYIPSAPPSPQSGTVQAINDKVVQLRPERQEVVLEVAAEQLEEQNIVEVNELLFEYRVYEKAAAGNGYCYTGDRNYDIAYFDEEIPHDFATWIWGDSMEPKYFNGEVALIRDSGYDYDGAIYLVDWDGQSYIKKVYKEKDGLRLVSLNKKYADKFAAWEEEPRIIGKLIGSFRPVER